MDQKDFRLQFSSLANTTYKATCMCWGKLNISLLNIQLGDRCSTIVKTFPTFYQELIELWCKISCQEPSHITQIHNQSLWNNSFLATQGKPILNLCFINKGLLKVSDILNDSGNLLFWHMAKSILFFL